VLLLPQYRAIREHLYFTHGTLYDRRQEPWRPLEKLLEVPRYDYSIDADGDVARKPRGDTWKPPASAALPMEPLAAFAEIPALAALKFAKIPYGAVTYYESQMVEPDRAVALWEAAAARCDATGLTPVICSPHVKNDRRVYPRRAEIRAELKKAADLDMVDYLAERRARMVRLLAEGIHDDWFYGDGDRGDDDRGSDGDGGIGTDTGALEAVRVSVGRVLVCGPEGIARDGELLRKAQLAAEEQLAKHAESLAQLATEELAPFSPGSFAFQREGRYVALVLVACKPWELPATIGLGGWNEAPAPDEQSAMLRHWSQKYGAELVAIGDSGYLEGRTRLLTPDQIKTLAWEMFLFCEDIVLQSSRTVARLAPGLAGGRFYLWWD
jgi:hypothetical protein